MNRPGLLHVSTAKNPAAVQRLQRTMGILIAVISWFLVIMNMVRGTVSEGRDVISQLLRPTVLPFVVFGVLSTWSIFSFHSVFRLMHIGIFFATGVFGAIVSNPGFLIGPILFVFGLILTLQYGFFARRGLIKFLIIIGLYSTLMIVGTHLYHQDENYNYLNGITTAGITILFTFMFYAAFAEEIRDAVTESRRMRREIERSRVFVEFGRNVAGVVHNLRSSLNAIGGYADIMQNGDSDKAKEHSKLMKTSVDNMTGMVGNLLFAVRSSQGTQERTVDFGRVIQGALELRRADLALKNRVRFGEEVEEGCSVLCAPLDALQIVQNLVQNACDATVDRELGAVEVSCRRNGERIEFTCSDDGSGIPWLKDRGRIDCLARNVFEIGKTTKEEGVGFGMVYVTETVARLGGTCHVESSSDGTTFTLTFPYAEAGSGRFAVEEEQTADLGHAASG